MKKALIIVSVFIVLLVLSQIFKQKDAPAPAASTTTEETATAATTTLQPATPPPPPSNWDYSFGEDKMSGTSTYYATCTAHEKLNFDFPYNGGSDAMLTVRKMKGPSEVYLHVSKGQFMPSYDESVRIKFDDEKPMTVTYQDAADGSSDYIFLNSDARIISKLKKAKKVIIEAPFYNEGRPQIEFDVEGLEWNR